jgi:sec-independent protein translocase protein TatC
MSLGQHLLELRKRLFISAIAIVAFSIASWFVTDYVWKALREPILAVAHSGGHKAILNYPVLTGAFDLQLQIAISIGVVVSSPVWLYQIFAFLVPGLTKKEKRYTFGFFFTAVPFFLVGCYVGWMVFPHIVALLTSFVPGEDANFLAAQDYLGFIIKLVLAVGVAFVLPVFLVLLNFIGILSAVSMVKSWRWAIIAILIFCAIATPAADPWSMLLLALPIVVLYFAAVGVAFWHDYLVRKRVAALDRELDGAATA